MKPPHALPHLGLGIGWRPELALVIERRADIGFVEITAENIHPRRVPEPLHLLHNRGVQIIPHGVSLSLGGADPISPDRVKLLATLAHTFRSPFVSEHIAFVRAGGVEAGHLLPIPRTRAALAVLIDNIRRAQDILPVPLALENISALFDYPGAEMTDAAFLREVLERTDTLLLLDTANVYANAHNLSLDIPSFLRDIPLARIAYCHVGGGVEGPDGIYHDTHAASVPQGALDVLTALCSLTTPPGVMLERDDNYPPDQEINAELDRIAAAIRAGQSKTNPNGAAQSGAGALTGT